jgi:hypothetical protein
LASSARQTELAYAPIPLSFSRISRSEGNRPSSFLEKILSLPTMTLKLPPLTRTIVGSMPKSLWISAARLEALGR